MGVDIHLSVVSNGKYIIESCFDGRNYRWFDKINNNEDEYAFLDWIYDMSNICLPRSVLDKIDSGYYYGFKYISISELLKWFDTYAPNITAGWVRKIDAWKHRTKHMPINEDDVYPYLDDNAIIQDWEFIEFESSDDCMEYVITQIRELIPDNLDTDNSYLVVCFDC